jgi:hypothetical protein
VHETGSKDGTAAAQQAEQSQVASGSTGDELAPHLHALDQQIDASLSDGGWTPDSSVRHWASDVDPEAVTQTKPFVNLSPTKVLTEAMAKEAAAKANANTGATSDGPVEVPVPVVQRASNTVVWSDRSKGTYWKRDPHPAFSAKYMTRRLLVK